VARREPNPAPIVLGLLFIGLGVAFLLDRVGNFDLDGRWIWPILLIGLGIAGVVRSRPRRNGVAPPT
jgi:hypothetical protein